MHFSIVLGLLATTAHGTTVLSRGGPVCENITIPVSVGTAGALGFVKRSLSSLVQVPILEESAAPSHYNISARFCEPEVASPERAHSVQLLVHGITYDKNYWSGLGEPGAGFDGDTYSWIAYASKQGYPTLSIDRLGNGLSDRPNGLTVVRMGTHVEVTQALVTALKKGAIARRAFDHIIYVGHWYGSLIGNIHAVRYPEAIETYVLTGFSYKIKPSLGATLVTGGFIPAKIAYPERWGNQSVSYFAASKEAGAAKLFFVNETVDQDLKKLNYRLRGTVTAGEFVSAYGSTQKAKDYRGRIFILTGMNDAIFCSPDAFGRGTLAGKGNCGTGPDSIIAKTKDLYPAAAVFDYDTPNNTGHCNILQFNAQEQFHTVHTWLDRFY